MTPKENAQITYRAIRKKKIEVARAAQRQADEYSITNVYRVKKRLK